MTNIMTLTDKSPMPWGKKYRGTEMANVPASYLLWAYDFIADNNINSLEARAVKIYVDENRNVIDEQLKENKKGYEYLND